jgi:hypothetical protein
LSTTTARQPLNIGRSNRFKPFQSFKRFELFTPVKSFQSACLNPAKGAKAFTPLKPFKLFPGLGGSGEQL